jgi:serine/threonine protein kinase
MAHSDSCERERRLDEIVAAYLKAVDAGNAPDRQQLLDQYPEFAEELAAFFDDQDQFRPLAARPQPARSSPSAVLPGPGKRLLEEGQVIRDTYEVERFLGQGAFAEVYRVRHRFLGRQAMKVLKAIGVTREETEQMLGEALILSRIGHPNIVRVFEANTTETSRGVCSFFTMEYVAGGSLEQFWRSHGARFMPVETAVEIIRQVCCGLVLAHGERPPIIHRDVKPQNILVGYDAAGLRVRVSDFGLAKRVNPLTFLASARGTPNFKPPEAFRDAQGDSRAGDVWAIGCTLYLLLTDKLPFSDPGRMLSLAQRFSRPLVLPSQVNLLVDPSLDRIMARALAVDPKARYASSVELLEDLAVWPSGAKAIVTEPKSESQAETSKTALGAHSPADEARASDMAEEAVRLAQQSERLTEAKDLLEEALNRWPALREHYEYHLKLWHRGIVM